MKQYRDYMPKTNYRRINNTIMKDFARYETVTDQEVQEAINHAVEIVRHSLPEFTHMFKKDASVHNFYKPEANNNSWTTGFWTGQIWLAYENTNDEVFRKVAEIQVQDFLRRIEEKENVDHHDMGFLYSLSCVAAYKLTGNETGKKAAILAADQLISRYQPVGEFIQAWGTLGASDNYRLIIDCLLNLPLLYWTSEVTGDDKYETIAKKHISTSLKNIMRDDHSTYHTFFFDQETGAPLRGVTCQGYRDGSAWARGQAWGVYGVALSYRYTKNPEYIPIFKDITDFFLTHLPEDLVSYWDFDFTDGSSEPRDSSAVAIAICGMLEMVKYMNETDSKYYRDVALKMLKSLIDHYSVTDPKDSNGLILHGVYAKRSPYNTCGNGGVDECNTWGDYFYFEALTRLAKDWELYW